MKIFIPALLLFLLASCAEETKTVNTDSIRTDSALKAQEQTANVIGDTTKHSKDTLHMVGLPPVLEGDLVFQNLPDEQSVSFGKATHSKYNNVGMIFMRPRDHLYMVVCVEDSVRAMPLTEWVDHGEGQHVALLRLKNANQQIDERRSKQLKQIAHTAKGRKEDHYFAWSDDELYCSELIWKLYNRAFHIDLCTPGPLSRFDLTIPLVSIQMKNKYGSNIPKTEETVSPEDIYKSPQLEIIFEK